MDNSGAFIAEASLATAVDITAFTKFNTNENDSH
jgi:hypothetical protein